MIKWVRRRPVVAGLLAAVLLVTSSLVSQSLYISGVAHQGDLNMNAEVVLITGASSGIGLELAKLFARDRSDLVLLARSESKLNTLAASLSSQYGISTRVLVKDLSQPGASQEVFDELAQAGVEIDVLVNNAGFGLRGPVMDLSVPRQLAMVQVNVAALTHLTLLFLPGMVARGRGGILNLASTAAFQPGPNLSTYYATKAYVLSFTEGLAEELRHTPVRVCCLAPGPTATGFGAVANMERTRLFRLGTMKAETVARAGYRGFRRGRVLVVPGFTNKLCVFMGRFTPRFLLRKIVKLLQS
jgi:uncharacterized protein